MEVFVSIISKFAFKKTVSLKPYSSFIYSCGRVNYSSGKMIKKTEITMPTRVPQPDPRFIPKPTPPIAPPPPSPPIPKRVVQPPRVVAETAAEPKEKPPSSSMSQLSSLISDTTKSVKDMGKKTVSAQYKKARKLAEHEKTVSPQPKPKVQAPSPIQGPPARPSDGKSYVVPEYYEHTKFSFVQYEIDMKDQRLPQPSSKRSEEK